MASRMVAASDEMLEERPTGRKYCNYGPPPTTVKEIILTEEGELALFNQFKYYNGPFLGFCCDHCSIALENATDAEIEAHLKTHE